MLKRAGKIERSLDRYKHHILLITSELIARVSPNINESKKIDDYCRELSKVVLDDVLYTTYIQRANVVLQNAMKAWIEKRGPQYRHGIKDNPNFTRFLLVFLRGGDTDKIEYDSIQQDTLRGRVVKSRRDRNGYNYGFIQHDPDDVFFHEIDNDHLDFSSIYGKTVLYQIFQDSVKGDDRAEILQVLPDESNHV